MGDNMQVVIYKGRKAPDTYLFVLDADALTEVPQVVLEKMGELAEVMELELHPGRKLARADVDTVQQAITDQGFYLQIPPPKEFTADPQPGLRGSQLSLGAPSIESLLKESES